MSALNELRSALVAAVDDPRLGPALELVDSLPWKPRPSGEDYRMHLLRVACRVRLEFGLTDPDLTLAALLHDVVEDHGVSVLSFGERVEALVRDLTNEGDYTAHVLGMLPGPAGPVKLADFMDNALALSSLEPDRAARLRAKYAPVAAGMVAWLQELPSSHPLFSQAPELVARISAQYP